MAISRIGTMNLSFDFMVASLAMFGLRRATIRGGPGTAVLRLLLAREDDLDAAVAHAAAGRRVRGDRMLRAVARRREAAGSDVVADEESDDGGRAGGRELPVGRERGARDRPVVGVSLDDDAVGEVALQQRRDPIEQRSRRRVERGGAAVVEHLVGEEPDDQAATGDRRLELLRQAVIARVRVDLLLERRE